MKKIFGIILLALPCALLAQGGKYVINGKVTAPSENGKQVFLGVVKNSQYEFDSVKIANGAYTFSGEVADVSQAVLIFSHGVSLASNPRDFLNILIDGQGKIDISSGDSIVHGKISGSKINDENALYREELAPVRAKQQALADEYRAATPEQRKEESFVQAYRASSKEISVESNRITRAFITSHPDSYVSANALSSMMGASEWDADEMEGILNTLTPRVRNMKIGQSIAALIKAKRVTGIGAIAPEFTQNDPNGKPVSLKDFRGKYLLIDFWASWCGPCRAENPNVVKAYNQYKAKGFEILGVSLDDEKQRDAWLAAIEKDGLTWPQVSDLKGWQNAAGVLYGVRAIPANYLLDPEGRIVATNLRGENLEKKLAEIFDK